MGFDVINRLSEKYDIKVEKNKFDALCGKGTICEEQVILCKPQTFMNLSGDSVVEFVNYYKIPLEKTIIVYDDIDTDVGLVRVRRKGSAGGHNGIKSIIQNLNSEEFPHVRIGIGEPIDKFFLTEYVIGKVSKEEYELLSKGIDIGVQAVEEILKNGIDNAMNIINAKN